MSEQSMSLAEIQAQIDLLEKQKQDIVTRQKEIKIAEIRKDIALFGITAYELGFNAPIGQKISRATTRAPAEKVVRYRNGDLTWSGGRGPKPKWISEMLASGQNIEQYRVAD